MSILVVDVVGLLTFGVSGDCGACNGRIFLEKLRLASGPGNYLEKN